MICMLVLILNSFAMDGMKYSLGIFSLLCIVPMSIFIRPAGSQYITFGFENGPIQPHHNLDRTIGAFSDVAQDLKLGLNCQIGSHCKIAGGCSMGDNVRFGNYARMERGSTIGSNCQIMDYATVGPLVTMGPNNLMNQYAGIEENADIGSGCIMGTYSNVGPSAKLEPNVYAGDYSQIGSNSVIGQNSIVQPYAMVPDSGHVGPNEMIIKTPTTSDLYKNSLPVNEMPISDVELADEGQPEELNERVRQLISSQKQQMQTSCQQNAHSVDFKPLQLVISLYLIRYDGLDRFIQNKEQGFGNIGGGGGVISLGNLQITGKIYINGVSVSNSVQEGADAKHFIEGAPKKVLEPELENDMVTQLGLKEDSQRKDRVPGDTFCKTVAEVESKQRKVKCDQSVDIGSPIQGISKTGGDHPRSPTNLYGSPNSDNYQPNRQNQQPLQPQQPNRNFGEIPNDNRPITNVPNIQYPNRPNNQETEHRQRPTHRYPNHNNTPETSNSHVSASPVNTVNDHSINSPTTENQHQHTTHHLSNNNEPERRPNPSNERYPNVQQSPSYPSNINRPNHESNNNGGVNPNKPPTQPRQPDNGVHSRPKCKQCNVQAHTSFGYNVELGDNLNIGESTTVGNNCIIKENAVIGRNVKICNDSTVYANAKIGNNCVLDDQSTVGLNANIAPGSYIGRSCDVGANAFIGENSIVLDNAKVPENGYVGANQVLLSTPTSADLYSSCAPIEEVPQNLISQPDPNNNLRQMMRGQIAQVRSYCQQSQQLLDFARLASAKTIYLLSLHGVPNFTNNRQNIMNKLSGSSNYDSAAYDKLMKEDHFVESTSPSNIDLDVKGEMIILSAIEQDFGRTNRVPGDSFCQTFMDIASNQRQVKCDKQ